MRKRPTPAELEILQVLWTRGPSTVREVQAELSAARPAGYTTVLKLLQIMADKDLVARNASERAHVYRARVPRETTQSQLVRELVDKAFGGSAARLVMHALSSKRATSAELAEIRRVLDDMEGDHR
jgi:predicted transcriptional regulator